MLRGLPLVVAVVLLVYCAVDWVQAPASAVRAAPKPLWLGVIVLFPILGPVLWLAAGRPRRGDLPPPGRTARPQPLGPDDDPDFLERLRWERERERRRREERPGGDGDRDGDRGGDEPVG